MCRTLLAITVVVPMVLAYQPDSASADGAPATTRLAEMSTSVWCKDNGTFCWSDREWFPGLRIVGDPNLGYLFQGGKDRFEPSTLVGTAKVGLDLSVYGAWLALEATVIPPFTAKFTESSTTVVEQRLKSAGRDVDVDYGLTLGIAAFDGIISAGGGLLFYNTNQFKQPESKDAADGFFFLVVNPISAARAIGNRAKQ